MNEWGLPVNCRRRLFQAMKTYEAMKKRHEHTKVITKTVKYVVQ